MEGGYAYSYEGGGVPGRGTISATSLRVQCYACLDTIVDSWAHGILAPSVQKALGILYIEVRISRMHEPSDFHVREGSYAESYR